MINKSTIKLEWNDIMPLMITSYTKHHFNKLGYGASSDNKKPWKQNYKNSFILCSNLIPECIGRLVQIRKNFSDNGLDLVILRLPNGNLWYFYDCDFYPIKKENNKDLYNLLEKLYEKIPLDDADKREYSIEKLKKEKGFIVTNKEYEKQKKEKEKKMLLKKIKELENKVV